MVNLLPDSLIDKIKALAETSHDASYRLGLGHASEIIRQHQAAPSEQYNIEVAKGIHCTKDFAVDKYDVVLTPVAKGEIPVIGYGTEVHTDIGEKLAEFFEAIQADPDSEPSLVDLQDNIFKAVRPYLHTAELPYKAFFNAMWEAYCDQAFELDDADTIVTAAMKHGLAKEEPYDPAIHGEALGDEWGIEPGEQCYVLIKTTPTEPVVMPTICGFCKGLDGRHYQDCAASECRPVSVSAVAAKANVVNQPYITCWKQRGCRMSIDEIMAAIERANLRPAAFSTIVIDRVNLKKILEAAKAPDQPVQETIEALAALEHDQWLHWMRTVILEEAISIKRKERWWSCDKPYHELTEEQKEHDRVWARKVLEIVRPSVREIGVDNVPLAIIRIEKLLVEPNYYNPQQAYDQNTYNRGLRDARGVLQELLPKGTYACPECGKDTPHAHSKITQIEGGE